ncbi:hypothetical protein F5148DRAFT_1277664 [Russula earlei]|uniref:Uncharacterized protein n=1 Tax=Russula earlei TaxID=71964 RepID=A0ACC0TWH9_9AGAM|nr:hypothetical protein F5148DRAFT_1277664 [Russula earlei]
MSGRTAQLKWRLDEQGINYTNKKAVENFCLIGTPLPPLEKKDSNEFVPLWKQDVRDEKGRRRLHGAFTGGFSSTPLVPRKVHSRWTPSTFVSSRSDRAKQRASRPEDYMDDEDLAELRESQLMVGVKEQQQRDAFGAAHPDVPQGDPEQDSMAASIQRALMPPPEDSPGVRLLKKMGWRPGQGVGPRVSWRTRKIQDLLAAAKSINGVDIDALTTRRKRSATCTRPATRSYPGFRQSRTRTGSALWPLRGSWRASVKGLLSPRVQSLPVTGFGLGALNEAEDDDIDVYDSTSRGDRTYMPYAAIRDADDSSGQRFPNGVVVLSGFALSPDPYIEGTMFPIPEIPEGWKPDLWRVWQKEPGVDDAVASASTRKSVLGKRKLTADQRGAILGETPLPSTRSVFDYLSKEDRERIEHAAAGLHPAAPDSMPGPVEPPRAPSSIPYTAPHTASAALKGFMPFTGDPAKQARYVAYLGSQSTPDALELLPSKLPGQTSEEYYKELSDYSKSAAIFKPVPGKMASRFTTAVVIEVGPNANGGLHQPTHEPEPAIAPAQGGERAGEGTTRREEEEQSSKAHAARIGMFGAHTRDVVPMEGNAWKAEEALAEADLQTATGTADAGPSCASTSHRTTRDLENIGLGEDDSQGRDTLTYVRPSMDIFKAIFASDDEDSDEDVEDDGDQGEDALEAAGPSTSPKRPEEGPTANADAEAIPAHLRSHDAAGDVPTYEPRSGERPSPGAQGAIDLATFKPVFVPRGKRETHKSRDKNEGGGRGKDRDRDKKRAAKAVVSFEDGEDAGSGQVAKKEEAPQGGEGKNAEGGEGKEEGDVETWVEKPPPQVVASFAAGAPNPPNEGKLRIGGPARGRLPTLSTRDVTEGPTRGRKRAIDFL